MFCTQSLAESLTLRAEGPPVLPEYEQPGSPPVTNRHDCHIEIIHWLMEQPLNLVRNEFGLLTIQRAASGAPFYWLSLTSVSASRPFPGEQQTLRA